ncbi:hypothetical protein KIF53_10460, partial [Chromobacterium subtsugae]|nr:hypothetical protein [Chromobacterium subtsugae]
YLLNRFALEGLRESTSGLDHEHCSLVGIIHLKLVSTGNGTDQESFSIRLMVSGTRAMICPTCFIVGLLSAFGSILIIYFFCDGLYFLLLKQLVMLILSTHVTAWIWFEFRTHNPLVLSSTLGGATK